MMSGYVSAATTNATYMRHIKVDQIKMKNQGVLTLLGKLDKDTPAAKKLGITHLDDHSLYILSEEDIFLMI